jgi:hypothetical protein
VVERKKEVRYHLRDAKKEEHAGRNEAEIQDDGGEASCACV